MCGHSVQSDSSRPDVKNVQRNVRVCCCPVESQDVVTWSNDGGDWSRAGCHVTGWRETQVFSLHAEYTTE